MKAILTEPVEFCLTEQGFAQNLAPLFVFTVEEGGEVEVVESRGDTSLVKMALTSECSVSFVAPNSKLKPKTTTS